MSTWGFLKFSTPGEHTPCSASIEKINKKYYAPGVVRLTCFHSVGHRQSRVLTFIDALISENILSGLSCGNAEARAAASVMLLYGVHAQLAKPRGHYDEAQGVPKKVHVNIYIYIFFRIYSVCFTSFFSSTQSHSGLVTGSRIIRGKQTRVSRKLAFEAIDIYLEIYLSGLYFFFKFYWVWVLH